MHILQFVIFLLLTFSFKWEPVFAHGCDSVQAQILAGGGQSSSVSGIASVSGIDIHVPV